MSHRTFAIDFKLKIAAQTPRPILTSIDSYGAHCTPKLFAKEFEDARGHTKYSKYCAINCGIVGLLPFAHRSQKIRPNSDLLGPKIAFMARQSFQLSLYTHKTADAFARSRFALELFAPVIYVVRLAMPR